jgi:hypothetical protein
MNSQDILRALVDCELTIRVPFPNEKPVRADVNGCGLSRVKQARHMLWMIDEARGFVREDRLPKAFRWLGFVQGVMWSFGIVSIEQAKEANRPKEKRAELDRIESTPESILNKSDKTMLVLLDTRSDKLDSADPSAKTSE